MAAPDLKRHSLVEPDAAPAKGSKPKKAGSGSGMDPKDRMKLIAAIVVIVAAGGGLAAYYGVFSKPPKDLPTVVQDTLTPEQKKEAQEIQKETEEMMEEMIKN